MHPTGALQVAVPNTRTANTLAGLCDLISIEGLAIGLPAGNGSGCGRSATHIRSLMSRDTDRLHLMRGELLASVAKSHHRSRWRRSDLRNRRREDTEPDRGVELGRVASKDVLKLPPTGLADRIVNPALAQAVDDSCGWMDTDRMIAVERTGTGRVAELIAVALDDRIQPGVPSLDDCSPALTAANLEAHADLEAGMVEVFKGPPRCEGVGLGDSRDQRSELSARLVEPAASCVVRTVGTRRGCAVLTSEAGSIELTLVIT